MQTLKIMPRGRLNVFSNSDDEFVVRYALNYLNLNSGGKSVKIRFALIPSGIS